mgnify:FL=1
MKKYLLLIAAALVIGFTSCDSDPSDSSTSAGGTKVEKLAGAWVVSVFTCDEQGDVADIDNWNWEEAGAFGSDLMTYNTAANKSNVMWVDDQGECNFGGENDYSHKVKVDVKGMTFSVSDGENEYGEPATIVGGKVLKNAATVEKDRGQSIKTDSIVYYVQVAGSSYGYLKVSGYLSASMGTY